jgi:two-component sensor histidine kinase
VAPGTTWLHRPLIVWVVLSFPDGRLRSRGVMAGVVASVCIAIPTLATVTWAMAVVGAGIAGLGVAELHRTWSWPSPSGRARGWAALSIGSALLLPFGAQLVADIGGPGLPPQVQEFAYAALTAAAGLVLLAAGAGRDRLEAEAVIALAEDGDVETTLAGLPTRHSEVGDPATRRAFDAAIAQLERNRVGQRDLAAAVEQVRRSRRRLVNVTVVERRTLRRKLAERVRPLLPEIDSVLGGVSTDDAAIGELLARCRAEVVGIAADLAVIADGLHPARLTASGLSAVEQVLSGGPAAVEVRLPRGRYPIEVEAAVWYACAEAVTNAIKHGPATHVQIDGWQDGGWLMVEVRDDGVGGAVLSERGGLSGLADRVAALDGTLGIDSARGRGTTVRVRLPVP